MTWFKVDDSFYRSRKVRRLGPDRVAAVGLWTLCGDWSADNLSDGFIPWEVVEDWDPTRKLAGRLVFVGLWYETEYDGEKGVAFHDWHDWQPTKDQVMQRRKADAERRARWREARRNGVTPTPETSASPTTSQRESREESRRDTHDASRQESRPGSALPDPTRPDPTRPDPQEVEKNTPSTAPRPGRERYLDGFDEFWQACPRKEGKGAARKAYEKAVKTGTPPADLLAAMQRASARWRRDRTESRFIPHPATWLNRGSYEDPPDPHAPAPTSVGGELALSKEEMDSILGFEPLPDPPPGCADPGAWWRAEGPKWHAARAARAMAKLGRKQA